MGNPLIHSARNLAKVLLPGGVRVRLRETWEQHLEWMLYVGRGVECPCCGGQYRAFLPHGTPVRKNARCQGCDSVERHRLLHLYLRERTNLFREKLRVLHFAPEQVIRRIVEPASRQYVAVDLESPLADIHLDITKLPFADNTFDAMLCVHVLEHIPDDAAAMREMSRVLRPGGWAILQVPLDMKRAATYEDWSITGPEERHKHFGQRDHVRWYGRDYVDRLRRGGFDVRIDPYVRELGAEAIGKFGLTEQEDVYYCTKSAR